MKTSLPSPSSAPGHADAQRGSVLITALIFSIILAVSLVSYLQLSTHSLRMAHRTFFADAADNLAETGLEEAVWSFNTMANSSDPAVIAAAWGNWTVGNTIADIYMASMGHNYTSAPSVSISGGGGTGATAIATIGNVTTYTGNSAIVVSGVASVKITNPGSGYTGAPTVMLSGGGGSGAVAIARPAATRALAFPQLDQNATGRVQVWVAGYDGSTNVPIAVAKATITPFEGAPIEKFIKVILCKNGLLPKGVIAKQFIDWNGHPLADSFKSSARPGVPNATAPYFTPYDINTARANTTVASLEGPTIDLGNGVVNGSVMAGPGVTVSGGTINGEQVGNFQATIALPTTPAKVSGTGYYDLGSAGLPSVIPRASDLPPAGPGPAADGNYYYFIRDTVIGATTVSSGMKVVIVGESNTSMAAGFQVEAGPTVADVGSATIFMTGALTLSGNDVVNTHSWSGALRVYTSTTDQTNISGNAKFYGCYTAPNSALKCNGGGNDIADMSGSFIIKSVDSNGHMSFHYDEGLNDVTVGKPWTMALWKELQSASERALYASKFTF